LPILLIVDGGAEYKVNPPPPPPGVNPSSKICPFQQRMVF
jgi:hypothetical protein